MPTPPLSKSDHLRRSRIAAGIGLALLIMLFETVHIHQVQPSPWSPWVWTVLGSASVVLLVYAAWAKRRSLDASDD